METAHTEGMKALPAVLIVGIIGLGFYVVGQQQLAERALADLDSANAQAQGPSSRGSTGTSGDGQPLIVGTSGSPAVIQDLETITGSIDGHELVGRRVDVHVPVQKLASSVAFWAGPADNRILVALPRATHESRDRRHEERPAHRTMPVHDGEQAMVSGSVQRVPEKPEDLAGWQLTDADRREVADRNIYIRADRVTPSGHGH